MNTLQLGQTYATRDGKGSGRVVADDLSWPQPFGVVVTLGGDRLNVYRNVEYIDAYATAEKAQGEVAPECIAIAYPVEVPAE